MKIVDDWKDAWRWASVQLSLVIVVLPQTWSLIPDDVKAMIPADWNPWIVSAMGAAVFIGRIWKQRE